MPKRTFIAKSQNTAGGYKAAKDRMTLLLCSNATSDKISRPLLINKFLMPAALDFQLFYGELKGMNDGLSVKRWV